MPATALSQVLGEKGFAVDRWGQHGLSPREAQAMALILRGNSPAAVALQLGITPRTVDKHVERAYRRLGVRSRTEAMATLVHRSGA
ncbi:unannotated protein [freshwater metagenome]|uniref:Unannotated protein n=1 Tax=freshwater metagenome TaxID=449393 RepID=A0A6J7CJX5_9ZZZZ|nr:hypothetical protein [Actinomycetota bacterium]